MALLDHLDESWQTLLADEFDKPYWPALDAFVEAQREEHPDRIYPVEDQTFAALNFSPYDDIKVVLLGQDPYHGPGQAHGFCFSVLPPTKTPPSLRNIFKEMATDIDAPTPNHGDLTSWARQGVLLLNAVLTVRHKEANSHKKQGWEKFTDAVIKKVNERVDPVIFLLWGGSAKKKARLISDHHIIIQSAHPSPLSARNGFFGSAPFSKINTALEEAGKEPIDWALEDI